MNMFKKIIFKITIHNPNLPETYKTVAIILAWTLKKHRIHTLTSHKHQQRGLEAVQIAKMSNLNALH